MKNWKQEFPKSEGSYWFYGYLTKNSEEPELIFCVCELISTDNFILVGNGQFIFESALGGEWYFKEVELPRLPRLKKKFDE